MRDVRISKREREPGGGSRRRFLAGTAALIGAAGYACAGMAWAKKPAPNTPLPTTAATGATPFKISLAQSSLHKEFSASRLDPLDFARAAAGLHIDAVEYAARFYPGKASDRAYLAELKRRAVGEGVASLLIRVDDEGPLGAPLPTARHRAVDRHKKWVEAAAFLGCHSICVNASSQGDEDDQANWLSDGLRRLCDFGDRHGIDVLVDNRGGLSSKGGWLAEVLAAVGHRRAGSLPDFGPFAGAGGAPYDRYQGVRDLMPFARGVGARASAFDDRGEETSVNYALMLEAVTGAGYRGHVGIRYDGARLSEYAGIERTRALLERVRSQRSARRERGR